MRVLLFNPENDLALAAESAGNRGHFSPSSAAFGVRRAGALLPLWWSEPDDVVLLPSKLSPMEISNYKSEAEWISRKYGLCGHVATPEELKKSGDFEGAIPVPWGWSRYTRHLFDEAGIADLPSDAMLDRYMLLSHRRTTIDVNIKLQSVVSQALSVNNEFSDISLPPLPAEAASVEEILELIDNWGSVMVKLPWSCSSRGVVRISRGEANRYIPQLSGMLKRQKSVMVEKYLHVPTDRPDRDFAALFESDGLGHVRFKAWSVFSTDDNGRYVGNIVAPQIMLEEKIHISGSITAILKEALENILSEVIGPYYKGWLGVDMMHWSDGEGKRGIAPCVEINLRYTMGVASYYVVNCLLQRSESRTIDIIPSDHRDIFPLTLNVTPKGILLR